MNDREKICLENGPKEFWIVDPKCLLVKVSTPDGHATTYRSGQQIRLPLFNGAALEVATVFVN